MLLIFDRIYLSPTVVGCTTNRDCPTKQACSDRECINPCQKSNPCKRDEKCDITDHVPSCLPSKRLIDLLIKHFVTVPHLGSHNICLIFVYVSYLDVGAINLLFIQPTAGLGDEPKPVRLSRVSLG